MSARRPMRGSAYTMVELVVVIALTGVVAAMGVAFLRAPVLQYVDTARRAELSDAADTALRRITRDLRTALPNSVRVKAVGGVIYLEYLHAVASGRYREYPDSAGAGDPLDFHAADGTFEVIGALPPLAAGDAIVVFNVSADEAPPTGSNAYAGDNRARYLGDDGIAVITIDDAQAPGAPKLFPFPSPGRRFHVVRTPVTYVCDPAPGVNALRRYWNYTIQAVQPVAFAPAADSALLASDVTNCVFSYNVHPATQRVGVVSLALELTKAGESVRLFQQVHVNNVP